MTLCAVKFLAGIISGSLSITADAVNNLSDASSNVISLLGFKLSEKNADREHPYGHGRYEYLAGFVVSALIIVIGAELLRDSIVKIISPTTVDFGVLTAILLAISIPIKLLMMAFNSALARKIHSESLKAAACDSRNDAISTAAVLTALIISEFTGVELDGIMGAAVAVFILIGGIGLIRDAMNPLLGKAPDPETVERIRTKILSYDGVLGTHDLMIHDYGPGRQFASVHVEFSAEMSLVECHSIIDRIERDFLRGGLNMLVHPDPIVGGDTLAGQINAELSRIVNEIDERVSVHDVRVVYCGDRKKVIFDCVLPPEVGIEKRDLTDEITRFLRVKFPDCRPVIFYDTGYATIPKTVDDE